jgi:deoxycytidylate deaminase
MKVKYFKLAKKLSYYSTHHKFKLGCVITKKNQVVGVGFNELKTHPFSKHPYNQLHAEINAILNSDKRELKGSDLYIYREQADGNLALSKPCQYCKLVLDSVGIKNIFYTNGTGYAQLEVANEN